jgi:hypothetical protein
LKENFSPITDALEKTLALQGIRFTWKDKKESKSNAEDGAKIGFIAQEAIKTVPEAVYGTESETSFLSMDYGSIVALLVETVKDLNAKIEDHEIKINKLQQRAEKSV